MRLNAFYSLPFLNRNYPGSGMNRLINQTTRIMRILSVIMLACTISVSAKTSSQTITFKGSEVPLTQLFSEIKKQTGFLVMFSNEQLSNAKPVSLAVDRLPLSDFVHLILTDQPLTFTIENNTVFIRGKRTTVSPPLPIETPPITIRGRVLNERGEPVIASVIIKGTKTGTTTDNLGLFTLQSINENAVLVVSGIGIATTEIAAADSLVITVKASNNPLDEVVFKGYYSTSKRNNTGAVSTVKADQIQTQPVTNPLIAVSGRMAGVNILQSTGMPGSAVKIEIRGRNSIRNDALDNGNLPLYIIDGVPFPPQIISATYANFSNQLGGSPLNLINPADIERIDILKDADATAAYGSRGANGVVLITTKKGKSGKMSVNVNAFTGFGKVSGKIDLMNTPQYRLLQRETAVNNGFGPLLEDPANDIYFPDIKLYDSTRYTDWQQFYLGGTSRFTNIQAGLSGGSDNVQYLFNSTFSKEGTVFFSDKNSKKGLFNLNLGFSNTNKKFKANISLLYNIDNTNLPIFDITPLIYTAPNAPAAFVNGEVNWDPRYKNANRAAITEKRYSGRSDNFISNSTMSYEITTGLLIRMQAGYNRLDQQLNTFSPLTSSAPGTVRFGSNDFNTIKIETYNLQPEIEYSTHIASGELSALVSGTWQQSVNQQSGIYGNLYTSDLYLENIYLAPSTTIVPAIYNQYKYNGFLGKLTYNWLNKYIMNLIGRRDGSSRFGANQQFGNFGSVGAAWIFSNEPFIKNSGLLSFGKLRASYGTTGSDQIGDYGYSGTYQGTTYRYDNTTGLMPVRIPNPLFSWEKSKKMDVALEIGILNDRILLSTGYYRNRTSNQLVGYPLPPSAGSPTGDIQANSPATVQNSGVEIEITSKNIKTKDLTWITSFNLTVPRNKLVSYPNIEGSAYANRLVVGQPLSISKYYKYVGVDPQTGLYTVVDQNNDGIFDSRDYVAAFRGQKLFGGLLNSFTYKGFQLDFHFQFVKQTAATFFQQAPIPITSNYNYPVEVLDRWQKTGDQAKYQKSGTVDEMANAYYRFLQSDAIIGDASFIRLKNLSLSWSLPLQLINSLHAQQARVYAQAQNLLTITNYLGLDPETASSHTLPTMRMITFGLQCVF